jgi:hypothetical protein
MKMKNIAAIYNICELRNKNTEMYKSHLESLLSQNYPHSNYKIIVSGCGVTDHTKEVLKQEFKDNIHFVFYNDPYKSSVTFNKTIDVINENGFSFDEYMYIASDINITNKSCFEKINSYSSDEFGIIQFEVDRDCGWKSVSEDTVRNFNVGNTRYYKSNSPHFTSDVQIKVGYSANLHCLSFNSNIYKFYNKILPDIFYWCQEPVLPYMASALKYKHIIVGNMLLSHLAEQDRGDLPAANGDPHALMDSKLTDLSIKDILTDYAKSVGFGFYEFHHKETKCSEYMNHDESLYDENGICKNEELKHFIKNTLFSHKNKFDYDSVKYQFS